MGKPKRIRHCYLCDWENASTQKPKRWIMCMDCYKLFSASITHDSFKGDCLRLYKYMYAAGRHRKDLNEDRAERFLTFLMTGENPPGKRQMEATYKDVYNYQKGEDDESKRGRIPQPKLRGRSSHRVLSRRRFTTTFRNQEVHA